MKKKADNALEDLKKMTEEKENQEKEKATMVLEQETLEKKRLSRPKPWRHWFWRRERR